MHKDYARRLRRNMTDAERRLWYLLRNRRLAGYKFRRQVPVGPFIVDFLCREAGLIVELDGSQHIGQADYDSERTKWLAERVFVVLRYWNNAVLTETDGVCANILQQLEQANGRAAHNKRT